LPRLYLNHDADYDWLIALEFGLTDDGQPAGNWRPLAESFAYLASEPAGGRLLGFVVRNFSEFDPEDDEVSSIWADPRFDVPVLGLSGASAGEIVVAARPFLAGASTVNRHFFHDAVAASDEPKRAVDSWRYCLQAGDVMAHFGLGYTLYDQGRYHEAYRHLRAYTEITPTNPWAWCWLGKACEALGETVEAERAYRRALRLEEAAGDETDAGELLEDLNRRRAA
jgi:tetratricopeptide (TPR) repeat protein